MKSPPLRPEALRLARAAGRSLTFVVSGHGEERMAQEDATARDVGSAMSTAAAAAYDETRRTWKLVGGRDVDGEKLDVVVSFRFPGPLVVTVIRP